MTQLAALFMGVSVTFVTALTVWCYSHVLRNSGSTPGSGESGGEEENRP